MSATVEYETGDLRWTQSFTTRCRTEAELSRALEAASLAFGGYLTDDHVWLRALPRISVPS